MAQVSPAAAPCSSQPVAVHESAAGALAVLDVEAIPVAPEEEVLAADPVSGTAFRQVDVVGTPGEPPPAVGAQPKAALGAKVPPETQRQRVEGKRGLRESLLRFGRQSEKIGYIQVNYRQSFPTAGR